VHRDDQGSAAGRELDAEDAVFRSRKVVLTYPAAQQVLHGCGLAGDVRIGVVQQVQADGTAQPYGLPGPGLSLLPGDGFCPRARLEGSGVAVRCRDGVQVSSLGGGSGSCRDELGLVRLALELGVSWVLRVV
jgi:hypothetical protein